MMMRQRRRREGRAAALDDGVKEEKFPIVAVATNGLVVSVNAYAVFQLFTYVGVMVATTLV